MRSRVLSSFFLFRGALLALTIAAIGAASVNAAAELSAAGAASSVECLAAQFREGASAYRECAPSGSDADGTIATLSFDERFIIATACQGTSGSCIQGQLDALAQSPGPFLGALNASEQQAARQQCLDASGRDGVARWTECLERALSAVEALPAPLLDGLSPAEQGALERRCAAEAGTAAEIRQCQLRATNTTFDRAAAGPANDTAEVSDGSATVDAMVAQAAEAPAEASAMLANAESTLSEPIPADTDAEGADANGTYSNDAADAEDVADTLTNDTDETPTIAPSVAPLTAGVTRRVTLPADVALENVEPDGDTSTEADVVDAASDLVTDIADGDESIVTAQPTPATGAAEPLDESAPPPDIRQRAIDARDRLTATVAGLDGTERIVLFAALALPLLLLSLWILGRDPAPEPGGQEYTSDDPVRNPALVDRVAPSLQRAGGGGYVHDDDTSDEEFFAEIRNATGAVESSTLDTTLDDIVLDASDLDLENGEPIAATSGVRTSAGGATTLDNGPGASMPFTASSSFGQWLADQPHVLQRQHAIEFLIYWVAYGDERYEPEMAATLLHSGGDDGDPHDLIKRRVLEKDAAAFADAVRWMQTNCGELERVQIIDLLLVLLVVDGAMTPVQNTLLHFLADAFGLGQDGLDHRHEEAFGQPMPSLARTDLPVWWEQLDPSAPMLWDARAVSVMDDSTQQRLRLGLPIEGPVEDSRIVEAFRRATRRCQSHRFDSLGERERALAERQLTKFEEARDSLLGVGA